MPRFISSVPRSRRKCFWRGQWKGTCVPYLFIVSSYYAITQIKSPPREFLKIRFENYDIFIIISKPVAGTN